MEEEELDEFFHARFRKFLFRRSHSFELVFFCQKDKMSAPAQATRMEEDEKDQKAIDDFSQRLMALVASAKKESGGTGLSERAEEAFNQFKRKTLQKVEQTLKQQAVEKADVDRANAVVNQAKALKEIEGLQVKFLEAIAATKVQPKEQRCSRRFRRLPR